VPRLVDLYLQGRLKLVSARRGLAEVNEGFATMKGS